VEIEAKRAQHPPLVFLRLADRNAFHAHEPSNLRVLMKGQAGRRPRGVLWSAGVTLLVFVTLFIVVTAIAWLWIAREEAGIRSPGADLGAVPGRRNLPICRML
jgi:hypothetical protein